MVQKAVIFAVTMVIGIAAMGASKVTGDFSVGKMIESSADVFRDVADMF